MAKLGPDRRKGYQELSVVEGYDKWAPTYDQDPNPLIALEEKVTLDMMGNVEGRRVLDLGCGTGRYCALLARLGAKVVGLDPSREMLRRARPKITAGTHFELKQGTIDQVDYPDGHFDLIVSALTFGHLPELEPVFGEVVRLLKENGRLVISDIHPYWPVSGHDYTEFFEGGQEYRIPTYSHLLEEYWRLCMNFGLHFEDFREPRIDHQLVESFPSLRDYEGTPLAIVLKLRKDTRFLLE
jgi:malonyl-CoA O-methyltransferase